MQINKYIKLAEQGIELTKTIKMEGIVAPIKVDQELFEQAFDK